MSRLIRVQDTANLNALRTIACRCVEFWRIDVAILIVSFMLRITIELRIFIHLRIYAAITTIPFYRISICVLEHGLA